MIAYASVYIQLGRTMTTWWSHHQQQQQHSSIEPYDYSSITPGQPIGANQSFYGTTSMIADTGANDEYIIHPTAHGNMNDAMSNDFHHRRNWLNGNSNDDRKAKSRVAAKHRRSAENKEFTDLSKLLPLQQQIAAQLDKASIIRLTISYLRLHQFLLQGDPVWPNEPNISSRKQAFKLFNADESSQLLQSLDGFIFALSSDGRILYISESVSSSLGLSMVEMTGNSIFNYLHDDDKKVFADELGFELLPPSSPTTSLSIDLINAANNDSELSDLSPDQCPRMQAPKDNTRFEKKSVCVRMRSSLTKRAPNMKTPGYRSVQIIGEYRWLHPDHRRSTHNGDHLLGFVGTALIPSLSPSQNEFPIPDHQYVIRLDERLHITHMDDKLQKLLNWNSPNAASLYLYVHPDDLKSLTTAHRDLPFRQQLVLDVVRLQMNTIVSSSQSQQQQQQQQQHRKANSNNSSTITEQSWVWCDLLATMMQSKTNDENFVILVIEVIGLDDGFIKPMIDEDLEKEYATRVPYRSQISPNNSVDSSSPNTNSTRSINKNQRQESPYPNEAAVSYFPLSPAANNSTSFSSSPHARHLTIPTTPSPSPSSPNSPLPTSRPSVIITKPTPGPLHPHHHPHHHHHHHHHPQHYHPYSQYDCSPFTQQQYSITPNNEHWYYQTSSFAPNQFPNYHHPPHHLS